MALFLTATLGLSIAGMLALLIVKRYEMTTGRVVLGQARPKVGAFFNTCLTWVESVAPSFLAKAFRQNVARVKKIAHQGVARGILTLERALEWVLQVLHYTTHPHRTGAGEASAFLREVAEHKRKLLEKSSDTVEEK